MDRDIQNLLTSLEEQHNITIPYAVEQGSRHWGWSQDNSDYDIRSPQFFHLRFIYTHPLKWYLTIDETRKDTLDFSSRVGDVDADLSGYNHLT